MLLVWAELRPKPKLEPPPKGEYKMTVRKTLKVAWLRDKVNTFLMSSTDDMRKERLGMAAVLEAALFETDNYKGYSYLSSEWDEEGQKLREGYDDSRRCYH